MPKEKKDKLPERLSTIAVPLGLSEHEVNRFANEYNSLRPTDPRRREIYEKYRDAQSWAHHD